MLKLYTVNKLANGISHLSFHEERCTKKWNSILNEGSLKNNAAKSFISLLMRRTDQKKKKMEEEKAKVSKN